MKIQKQEESMENTHLKIKVKMGFVEELNQLKVELVSLQGIKPRAGKNASKIKIYLQKYPNTKGENNIQRSPAYPDVEGSIAFDLLEEEPVEFLFKMDDTEENMFITVIVFDINKAGWKYSVGECVVQVSFILLVAYNMLTLQGHTCTEKYPPKMVPIA